MLFCEIGNVNHIDSVAKTLSAVKKVTQLSLKKVTVKGKRRFERRNSVVKTMLKKSSLTIFSQDRMHLFPSEFPSKTIPSTSKIHCEALKGESSSHPFLKRKVDHSIVCTRTNDEESVLYNIGKEINASGLAVDGTSISSKRRRCAYETTSSYKQEKNKPQDLLSICLQPAGYSAFFI